MPRAKKNPHQHNSKHEVGVVAPGKRVKREKSNGHINEEVDTNGTTACGASNLSTANNVDDSEHRTVSENAELYVNGSAAGSFENNHRRIDVSAGKSPTVHDTGNFSLALTILWSCPIGDTLAILIFLLSLPPTSLALTNTLFAVLAFMPPATSISTFPTTLNDIFQGSGVHHPSPLSSLRMSSD